MRRLWRFVGLGLAALVVLALAGGLIYREEIVRLRAVATLFEADRIVVHVATDNERVAESPIETAIRRRFHEVAEMRPNAIRFHSMEAIRERLGVGRLLKEEKIQDNRPEARAAPRQSGARPTEPNVKEVTR